MRKSVFTVAVAGAAIPCAHAQNSVTLYGVLDEGLMFLSHTGGAAGGKLITVDSVNGMSGSRWGMTGSENLGGGLHAIFTLEGGVNLNTGQAGQGGTFFGRRAFVGLGSDQYGTLTLGRQYDEILYFIQPLTSVGSQAGSTAFAHPGDLDNTANSLRANNAVQYISASYGGFTVGGEYSLGGQAGDVTANSGYSMGMSYANGSVRLAVAYEYFKDPTSTTAGTGFFTGNANGSTSLRNSLNNGYTSALSYQVIGLGAGYTVGTVSLATAYTNIQYGNMNAGFNGQSAHFNNLDFSIKYLPSPAVSLSAAYDYLKGESVTTSSGVKIGNQHYNQFSLMGDYLLSKATDVYLEGAYQRASGISSTGGSAVADIGNVGDANGNHQFLFRVGLRHLF
ncbi:porin [Paraburkholderia sp. DHOC27]|uniref:porin n=1 Tax=Paraburkholderia sp. DHOC27 TaxID=2303330 RepID=UPI000E3B8F5C|nr:porin [Paraburkholderia sp. DHOC27]RFU44674.1 porin [Paraburkholderia sp. DHOC27]